ncbi:MAG TPA: hypothetical protein VEJ46_18905 [Candidatus Acidoferrum sp.]|nr:hypothetical protein [Candidatus Acidoferrum sp.]
MGRSVLGVAFAMQPMVLRAQDNPTYVINEDCQTFDISANNAVVFAVPRIKGIRRLVLERDDISVADGPGKIRRIVDADKFMPIPPTEGYMVDSLAWSPDGHRIAMNMSLQKAPSGFDDKNAKKKGELSEDNSPLSTMTGGRAIALLDDEGREIKVAGLKTRFIENGVHATWLADDATVVYQTGGGPYSITRVRPADGQETTLFEGHTFNVIIWDAKRNRAFAIGENLGVRKGLTLVQLDLMHELVTEIAHIESYQGSLSLSPSGTKIGYFEDGDYIDVIDIANPGRPVRVRTGFGRFEWSRDERRVLLKRGPPERSDTLFWVDLRDGSFTPILHDLVFHDFRIAPDGRSIAVAEPGKRVLKVYSLP